MPVDLHTHSNRSDGTEPPHRIVSLAAAAGLSALALTDHDVLDGIPEARAAAEAAGIRLVPGVELSVAWPTGRMHMLGYWIEDGPLADRLDWLRDGRSRRNRRIVAALRELGMDITDEEVAAEAAGPSVGRPHIASVLLAKGYVGSIAEAFDGYLAAGRPAYRERDRLGAADAVDLIHRSGGVAVIAHPHTIADTADGFEQAFDAAARLGVDGMECWYAEYPPDLQRRLAGTAERHGMVAAGGSDFHGDRKPGIRVGVGRGALRVPDSALGELEKARRRYRPSGRPETLR